MSALLVAERDSRTDSTLGPAAALFVLIAPCRTIIFRSDVAAREYYSYSLHPLAATMEMNMYIVHCHKCHTVSGSYHHHHHAYKLEACGSWIMFMLDTK